MTEHLTGYSGADPHNLLTVSDQLILKRLHVVAYVTDRRNTGDFVTRPAATQASMLKPYFIYPRRKGILSTEQTIGVVGMNLI